MDTAKVKTPDDFIGPPKSPKRKRHTSIACECCRKLKIRYVSPSLLVSRGLNTNSNDNAGPTFPVANFFISSLIWCQYLESLADFHLFHRCLGGESTAIGNAQSVPKSCNHCVSQSKTCIWPGEDGRKKGRTSSPAGSDVSFRQGPPGKASPYGQAPIPEAPWQDSGQSQGFKPPSDYGISPTSRPPPLARGANGQHSMGERSNSSASETPYITVHYHRHLGPTAIAP